MSQTVLITRFKDRSNNNFTLGEAFVLDEVFNVARVGVSLERGWRDNLRKVSCVPLGRYPLKKEMSDKFGKELWELKEVVDRNECKIHVANFWKQLNGCISFGEEHVDINLDGDPDVTSSGDTVDYFHSLMIGDEAEIEITDLSLDEYLKSKGIGIAEDVEVVVEGPKPEVVNKGLSFKNKLKLRWFKRLFRLS